MKMLLLIVALLGSFDVWAQGSHVGGGDTCRDELNKHREMLYQWIASGDASDLDFSQSKTDVRDFAEYQRRMLEVLAPGKVVVTCYLDPSRIQDPEAQRIVREQGVSYKAIELFNPMTKKMEPVPCINYEDASGISRIDCNYDSIVNQKALEDPNYQLDHHENASIAGVELRKTDSVPDFTISRQLSQYERWVTVKRLGKKVDPGKKLETLAETGVLCSTDYADSFAPQKRHAYLFSWKPNGDFVLVHRKSGKGQNTHGYWQRQIENRWQNFWWNIEREWARFRGPIVDKVLYRGNSLDLFKRNESMHVEANRSIVFDDNNRTKFILSTQVEIENTPDSKNGILTEAYFKLHLWDIPGIPKRDRFKVHSMICLGMNPPYYNFIGVMKDIEEQTSQTVFKRDYIDRWERWEGKPKGPTHRRR